MVLCAPGRSPVVRCNPTTSSPPLCRLDSRRNAFCVTNSRCFPIVTLPSLSVGMCVYLRVAAGWGVGGGGLDLSAGWRIGNGEKKRRGGQAVDCLELQLISTLAPTIIV